MENKNEIIVNDGWFNLHNINLISEIQTIKDTQTTILNEINNLKNLILNTQSNLIDINNNLKNSQDSNIETECKDSLQKETKKDSLEIFKSVENTGTRSVFKNSESELTSLGVFKNTFGDVITPRFLKTSQRLEGNPEGFLKTLDEHKILEERKKNLLIRSKIPFHFYSYSLNNLTDINTFNNIKMHSDFKNKSET